MKRYALPLLCLGATTSVGAKGVIVIVADDLGKDVLQIYDTPTAKRAHTPNLDRLAARGVTYDNLWGSPLSSPARAAMLTGRYGHHTGVTSLNVSLPLEEVTLFEALPEGYANALFGKWHLSQGDQFAPSYGIDHFAGFAQGGAVRDYNSWRYTSDGVTTLSNEYITTKITDDARQWIEAQRGSWFCWVAYNAPHTPFHLPPKHMHSQKRLSGKQEDIERDPLPYYLAMVESLDYELGRLLEVVGDDTTIIFVGDNGTDNNVLQPPYPSRHGKGSLYEAGVSIPMVVAGEAIPASCEGGRSASAINMVDIFPTVMELAGCSMSSYQDSYSFLSTLSGGEGARRYTFSEINHQRFGYMAAVSDGEYKIITTQGASAMLFHLATDPLEQRNLLAQSLIAEAKGALERLEAELERMAIPPIAPIAQNPQSGQGQRRPQMRSGNGGGAGSRPAMRR